jgi:hypothetical protein
MVLLKNIHFRQRFRMQIRAEFFNLLNHPQFRQPGSVIENPGTFGLSTQTLTRPNGTTSARQIQLALKLNFQAAREIVPVWRSVTGRDRGGSVFLARSDASYYRS